MALIEQWVRSAYPSSAVVGRDSRTYYAVHQGNVRKWFVRFNLQKPPFWVSFRHVVPEEIRAGLTDASVSDGGQFGDSKAVLTSCEAIAAFKPFVLLAFDREMKRVDQPESGSVH